MISFRDQSFCASDCVNRACDRNYNEDVRRAAVAWWGNENPPVSFMDHSLGCPDYEPAPKDET